MNKELVFSYLDKTKMCTNTDQAIDFINSLGFECDYYSAQIIEGLFRGQNSLYFFIYGFYELISVYSGSTRIKVLEA